MSLSFNIRMEMPDGSVVVQPVILAGRFNYLLGPLKLRLAVHANPSDLSLYNVSEWGTGCRVASFPLTAKEDLVSSAIDALGVTIERIGVLKAIDLLKCKQATLPQIN